ncbi:MAG: methyl-accepting chemotaxis protein [Ruminococcus sp.]|nr:methyl-accepting chemotaxis protein [Ruminococcus sp.]
MSKIGKSILIIVCSVLVAVAAVLTIVFMALFIRVETSNLKNSSQASANVLRHDFHQKETETQTLLSLISEDEKYLSAMESGNAEEIENMWNGTEKSDGIFAVFTDKSGNVIYKSNTAVDAQYVTEGVTGNNFELCAKEGEYMFRRSATATDSGMIFVGYSYDELSLVDDLMSQTQNHATIFCGNTRLSTTMLTESGDRAVGTTMSDAVYNTVIVNGDTYQQEISLFGEKFMATYMPLTDDSGVIVGAFFTGAPMAESLKNRSSVIVTSIVVAAVMMVIASLVFVRFVSVQISYPIGLVKNMAVEMEKGNLRQNPGIRTKLADNEVSELGRALASAIAILSSYINDISEMMKAMADGDFGYSSDTDYRGDFISIGQSAHALREKMKDVISQINMSADSVYSGSEQVSSIAGIIADGTTKQAAASEELSASISEISENIILNSQSAEKAQEISQISISNINSQSEQIKNMLEAMNNIEHSTNEISKIIKSIEDIASQTNILALNAAVEAARAGEAGKGFAVVAGEVRSLANKSAEAAQNTSALIENCMHAVNNGSQMAKKTAEAMAVVVENANNTNKLIDDINQQTALQAQAVKQVKSGVDMISEVVQQNSATAEESSANCRDLNSQAMLLRERISIFRV